MTVEVIGLIITFLLGLFILVGAILAIAMGNTNKIIEYSLGLALGVIITLIITDLIPEIKGSYDFVLVARGKTPYVKSSDIQKVMKKMFKENNLIWKEY